MLALALWTSVLGPAQAQPARAAAAGGADATEAAPASDPCPGCPEEQGGLPCAPTCTACAYLPFARSLVAPMPFFRAPLRPLLDTPAALASTGEAPSDPPAEGVFHPPRA